VASRARIRAAELTEQPERVDLGPGLDDLAVLDPVDADRGDLDRPAGGLDAAERATVSSTVMRRSGKAPTRTLCNCSASARVGSAQNSGSRSGRSPFHTSEIIRRTSSSLLFSGRMS
jgi:hypothetical protein